MSAVVRRLLFALGVLAAVNLVALAIFLGWLFATERMDGERFGELRALVFTPIPEARARREHLEAEEQRVASMEIERVRLATPPRTAGERAAEIDRALDQAQIRQRMVLEEARLLGRSLDERATLLRDEEAAFERQVAARRAQLDTDEASRRDQQFRRTVALLEGASPRQAKEWIVEAARGGRIDDAVRYLEQMSRFNANRILREMKSAEEAALAADLLHALQGRGGHAHSNAPHR
ncbi:MAG: hypothetical protein KF724_09650 [Phycisphaeraceae bacterium]|nr:hypothetical protein [Phycisphaeraceae bacterium]